MSLNHTTQELIDKGESQTVELIASPEEKDQIARAVCAFLNADGGSVIVGIDEKSGDAMKLNSRHTEEIERFLRQEITPKTLVSVSLDDVDDGRVVSIEVPKGSDRPFVYRGAIHVRSGKQIKFADSEAVRAMIRTDTDAPRWERQLAAGLTIEDLKRSFVERTVEAASANRGMEFETPKDLDSVLKQLSMNQSGEITQAADVLFGKWVAQHHPQTRVRVVAYESDRAGDRFTDEGLCEGPLLGIYDDVMAFLRRHVSVANEFIPGEMARATKPQYPFNSLREGLVNALVHRNYSMYSGSVTVSVYPSRIEIANTGSLPNGLTAASLMQAKHRSILVNPDICNVFYLNSLMERLGRGTFNIVTECKEFGLPAPKWSESAGSVQLTFLSSKKDRTVTAELSPRQLEILASLKVNECITTPEVVERFANEKVSARQARRDLADLVELGFLKRVGSARASAYERTELKP